MKYRSHDVLADSDELVIEAVTVKEFQVGPNGERGALEDYIFQQLRTGQEVTIRAKAQ